MNTKKLIIITIILTTLITAGILLFTKRMPDIRGLRSGALPKDPSSVERLKAVLPVTNQNFSITWNQENQKVQIEIFEPKDESLNALNTYFAENNFAQIPFESIEYIKK